MNLSKFALTDRVAIVAGGSGRVGKGIVLAFADAGAHVVVVGRTAETIEAVAAEVRAKGRKALAIPTDCTVRQQVNNMVDRTVKEFGRIDILAIAIGAMSRDSAGMVRLIPLLEMSDQDLEVEIANNLKAVFICAQATARVMVKQKRGVIINATGAGPRTRIPWGWYKGMGAYKVAQAGSVFLTELMAAEWAGYGIRVNGIGPRFIRRPGVPERHPLSMGAKRAETMKMIPLGHFGKTEDTGWAAVYLASDASEFVTGEYIRVDGGPNL